MLYFSFTEKNFIYVQLQNLIYCNNRRFILTHFAFPKFRNRFPVGPTKKAPSGCARFFSLTLFKIQKQKKFYIYYRWIQLKSEELVKNLIFEKMAASKKSRFLWKNDTLEWLKKSKLHINKKCMILIITWQIYLRSSCENSKVDRSNCYGAFSHRLYNGFQEKRV